MIQNTWHYNQHALTQWVSCCFTGCKLRTPQTAEKNTPSYVHFSMVSPIYANELLLRYRPASLKSCFSQPASRKCPFSSHRKQMEVIKSNPLTLCNYDIDATSRSTTSNFGDLFLLEKMITEGWIFQRAISKHSARTIREANPTPGVQLAAISSIISTIHQLE